MLRFHETSVMLATILFDLGRMHRFLLRVIVSLVVTNPLLTGHLHLALDVQAWIAGSISGPKQLFH